MTTTLERAKEFDANHGCGSIGRCDICMAEFADQLLAEKDAELEGYRAMIAAAQTVTFKYAPEVDITTYPNGTGKSILHYRNREGDWLFSSRENPVDTDFTGDRKWKEFNSPIDAWRALSSGITERKI